ncbi:hypothetical protein E2C01_024422 [Portunus trituberculatus]|uniref:Uncharacterized protein n=1 Tax=Portunus trituberculatus TaxID=210409 RepID=A0A5B7EDS3_PORTR|nr:hypothetical protein [Portunus trituberculatus]
MLESVSRAAAAAAAAATAAEGAAALTGYNFTQRDRPPPTTLTLTLPLFHTTTNIRHHTAGRSTSGTLPVTLVITVAKIDRRECKEPHLTLRARVPGPGTHTWPGRPQHDLTSPDLDARPLHHHGQSTVLFAVE